MQDLQENNSREGKGGSLWSQYTKLPFHLQFQEYPCVITDVIWMDQQILSVPVPLQIKVLWEQNGTLFDAWVDPNQVKHIRKREFDF